MAYRGSARVARVQQRRAVLARTTGRVPERARGRFIALAAVSGPACPAASALSWGIRGRCPGTSGRCRPPAILPHFLAHARQRLRRVPGDARAALHPRRLAGEHARRVLPLIGAAVPSALGLMLGFLVFGHSVLHPRDLLVRHGAGLRRRARSVRSEPGTQRRADQGRPPGDLRAASIFIVGAWAAGVGAASGCCRHRRRHGERIWASAYAARCGRLARLSSPSSDHELRAGEGRIDLDQLVRMFD